MPSWRRFVRRKQTLSFFTACSKIVAHCDYLAAAQLGYLVRVTLAQIYVSKLSMRLAFLRETSTNLGLEIGSFREKK